MLGLLPATVLLLAIFASRRFVGGWGEATLLAAVAWGTALTLATEVLGTLRALRFGVLAVFWGAMMVALLVASRRAAVDESDAPGMPRPDRFMPRMLLIGAGLVLVTTLFIALAAPPNTFDSMAYHMARVAHWQQHASVDHYPTAILRQLHQAPWAEYAILHMQILAGTDRFANLVQWLACGGSLVGVIEIARRLGARGPAPACAAAFCASLPMGIMQATSTQTDYVVAFWLVCSVWLVLVLRTQDLNRAELPYVTALGAAAGLAVLTKATAYLFLTPFGLWLIVSLVRQRKWRLLRRLSLATLVALALNASFFHRNIALYGAPLGPGAEGPQLSYTNDVFTPAAIISNVIRNLAIHAFTGSTTAAAQVNRVVVNAHELLRIDISDPATTWAAEPFAISPRWRHEDSAPNPLHAVVLMIASMAVVARGDPRRHEAGLYIAALAVAFVLFCALIKWQPWHGRLHLPLYVLAAPIVAIAAARAHKRPWQVVSGLLLLSSMPWLLLNESRPLLSARNVMNTPRSEQYFVNWPEIAEPYRAAASFIAASGCSTVGLVLHWNGYDYPLWPLLRALAVDDLTLRHVAVDNLSGGLSGLQGEHECAVFALAERERADSTATALNMQPALRHRDVTLYLPAGDLHTPPP